MRSYRKVEEAETETEPRAHYGGGRGSIYDQWVEEAGAQMRRAGSMGAAHLPSLRVETSPILKRLSEELGCGLPGRYYSQRFQDVVQKNEAASKAAAALREETSARRAEMVARLGELDAIIIRPTWNSPDWKRELEEAAAARAQRSLLVQLLKRIPVLEDAPPLSSVEGARAEAAAKLRAWIARLRRESLRIKAECEAYQRGESEQLPSQRDLTDVLRAISECNASLSKL